MTTIFDRLELQNELLEHAPPVEILRWTFSQFGDDAVMACSFEDLALLHMVHSVRPRVEIIFLDTGAQFLETLEFASRIEHEWDLNLVRTHPGPDAANWPCGTERCCELRKVEPLTRVLEDKAAWITAVRRTDSASRAATKIVSWDSKFGLVKVNPLATWNDEDIAYYLKVNALSEHPLWKMGYTSIGCAPVTVRPVGEARRSGRWVGTGKDECGLHTS
jgi:phosphoadenosine phosphosulfate reductase